MKLKFNNCRNTVINSNALISPLQYVNDITKEISIKIKRDVFLCYDAILCRATEMFSGNFDYHDSLLRKCIY